MSPWEVKVCLLLPLMKPPPILSLLYLQRDASHSDSPYSPTAVNPNLCSTDPVGPFPKTFPGQDVAKPPT